MRRMITKSKQDFLSTLQEVLRQAISLYNKKYNMKRYLVFEEVIKQVNEQARFKQAKMTSCCHCRKFMENVVSNIILICDLTSNILYVILGT